MPQHGGTHNKFRAYIFTLAMSIVGFCYVYISTLALSGNAQVLSSYHVEESTPPFPIEQALNDTCSNYIIYRSPSFIATQRSRQETLKLACQNRSSRPKVTISQLSNILVDDRHKMLYCAIPKVGCTNWKRMLVHMNDPDELSIKDTGRLKVHEYSVLHNMGIQRLSDFSREGIIDRLDSYYKFMFVRHPLERLLSAYRDKFTKYNKYTKYFHHRYGRTIIKNYRQDASDVSLLHGHDVKFPEFVKYIIDIGPDTRQFNPHWRQYSELCFPCDIEYNFIGNLESISEDSRYVLSRALQTSCPPKFPKARDGRQATFNSTLEYYRDIPNADIQSLERIYRDDMEMFHYESMYEKL